MHKTYIFDFLCSENQQSYAIL